MADVQKQKFVVLLRVSTKSQSADGLSIAAQRRDIHLFLQHQQDPEVVSELVEVESGAKDSRPVLEEALRLCRTHRAALLLQKVDRITRDLSPGTIVKDPEVTVRVASLPNADNFQIHLFGCLAASERNSYPPEQRQHLRNAKQGAYVWGIPDRQKSTAPENELHVSSQTSTQISSGHCGTKAGPSVKSVQSGTMQASRPKEVCSIPFR